MRKNQTPTLADLRAENVTDEERAAFSAQFREIAETFAAVAEKTKAWEAEATALFDALSEASLPEVKAYIEQHPPSAGALAFLVFVAQDRFRTAQARKNAAKSNAPKAKAKTFIQGEWERHRRDYGGNKSAFARGYVSRLKRELGVDVTEKTIRERWLKGQSGNAV